MKRLFSIVFFSALVAPFMLPYALMLYEQFKIEQSVKKKMLVGINRNELTCLKFATAEIETVIEWEHSQEFEYKNEMYDVVCSQFYSDSVIYWCWKDDAETMLNVKLKNYIAEDLGRSSENEKNKKNLVDFFKQFYFFNESNWNTLMSFMKINYDQSKDYTLMGFYFLLLLPPENSMHI